MNFKKLNIFNKKAKEVREYNEDEDYYYDDIYEENKTILNEGVVKSSLRIIEEPITVTYSTNVDDVSFLRKKIDEQNEYIEKLVTTKAENDKALIELRGSVEDLKQGLVDLRTQLTIAEAENDSLKEQLGVVNNRKVVIPQEEVVTQPIVEEKNEQSETEILIKHIKLSQAQNQKLEERLANMEIELDQKNLFTLGSIKRKKGTKKVAG